MLVSSTLVEQSTQWLNLPGYTLFIFMLICCDSFEPLVRKCSIQLLGRRKKWFIFFSLCKESFVWLRPPTDRHRAACWSPEMEFESSAHLLLSRLLSRWFPEDLNTEGSAGARFVLVFCQRCRGEVSLCVAYFKPSVFYLQSHWIHVAPWEISRKRRTMFSFKWPE